MKKTVLAIFAHPDDEAFGPAGSIALLSREYNVELICVTNGDEGENYQESIDKDLIAIRKKELEKSASILGISKIHFLNYKDGSLCNGVYTEIKNKVKEIIITLKPEIIITFEPRGYTGHLDHIAVTSIANHLLFELPSVKKIYYYCMSEEQRKYIKDYFVYFPAGYKESEIDMSIDISSVWNKKLESMNAHFSQKKDREFWMSILNPSNKKEYFLVTENIILN